MKWYEIFKESESSNEVKIVRSMSGTFILMMAMLLIAVMYVVLVMFAVVLQIVKLI